MAWLNERFPLAISYGSSFAHHHNVSVTTTQNGSEFRSLNHPFVSLTYNVLYEQRLELVLNDVLSLYDRANGMYRAFRVKDLKDYTTNDYREPPTAVDQALILDNPLVTNVFQLVRWYGLSSDPECARRIIKKPVAGTVLIAVDGIPTTTGWTVDNETGLVTFTVAPTGSVSGGCEFDIPCRFNTDFRGTFPTWEQLSVSGLEIKEVFNP